MLTDVTAAEGAGVFRSTPQALAASSLARHRKSQFFLVSPRWAIAAGLVMATGVWTLMFRANISDLKDRSRTVQLARVIDVQLAIASCVGGPSSSLRSSCSQVDFDGDGDVDLGDVSTYQRDFGAATR